MANANKSKALNALKRSLEPLGPNSQVTGISSFDRIEMAGGEGGAGTCKCYFCHKNFPDNQTYPCQVTAFREEQCCGDCMKAHNLQPIDFWDEWTTWNA